MTIDRRDVACLHIPPDQTTQPPIHQQRTFLQVVKPEDVRQDAVMMQVFSTVNSLLARDPAARRRALAIRTYRVVPLTPDSGVLEYVGNTKVRACKGERARV